MAVCALVFIVAVWIVLHFSTKVEIKNIHSVDDPTVLDNGIAFTLFTGFIAVVILHLYLSSFKPVKVLKGTFKGPLCRYATQGIGGIAIHCLIILIIGTIIVFKQIQFAKAVRLDITAMAC